MATHRKASNKGHTPIRDKRSFGNLSTSLPPPDIRGEGKKPLPDPVELHHIVLTMVLYVCRKLLLMDTQIKVVIYSVAVMVGSVFHDFSPFPELYFTRKTSFFNQYFVKLGWGWTFSLVGIYLYLTSFVYTCGNMKNVRIHLSRLGVGTCVWLFCILSFYLIESWSGICTNDKFLDKVTCLKASHHWITFDVSGHTFLLIYCNLLISEEGRSFIGWEKLGEMLRDDDNHQIKSLPKEKATKLKQYYKKYTPYIKGAFISLTCLSWLWEVMLCITVLYYHSLPQKFAGAVFAVACWFFTYKVWFISKNSPGLPGCGGIRYNK